jgi:hypothetical protein
MEVDFPPGNSASLDPSHMSNMQSQHLAKEVDSLEAESRNYQLSTIPANKV